MDENSIQKNFERKTKIVSGSTFVINFNNTGVKNLCNTLMRYDSVEVQKNLHATVTSHVLSRDDAANMKDHGGWKDFSFERLAGALAGEEAMTVNLEKHFIDLGGNIILQYRSPDFKRVREIIKSLGSETKENTHKDDRINTSPVCVGFFRRMPDEPTLHAVDQLCGAFVEINREKAIVVRSIDLVLFLDYRLENAVVFRRFHFKQKDDEVGIKCPYCGAYLKTSLYSDGSCEHNVYLCTSCGYTDTILRGCIE